MSSYTDPQHFPELEKAIFSGDDDQSVALLDTLPKGASLAPSPLLLRAILDKPLPRFRAQALGTPHTGGDARIFHAEHLAQSLSRIQTWRFRDAPLLALVWMRAIPLPPYTRVLRAESQTFPTDPRDVIGDLHNVSAHSQLLFLRNMDHPYASRLTPRQWDTTFARLDG